MNNKGMTLVELLVTFSLLMIILFGIFNLIIDLEKDLSDKQIIKDFTEFSSFANNEIHYDLVRNKPFVIAYKENNNSSFVCKYSNGSNCFVNNNILTVNYNGNLKSSDNLEKLCNGFYPCAIYSYVLDNNILFSYISINNGKDTVGLSSSYGINYNGTYEGIKNFSYIKHNDDIKIEIDDNGFFVINYPLYINGNDFNYGFKIAYPFIK